jgi:hypothetical protein
MDQQNNIFLKFRDIIYNNITSDTTNDIRISCLENSNEIIDAIKTLKVIEIDNFESFFLYTNYDYYLLFKLIDDYYLCDTGLATTYGDKSMIRLVDYSYYLRKDKINQINKSN